MFNFAISMALPPWTGSDAMAATPRFEITVEPQYLPADSVPEQRIFTFAYFVTIRNIGQATAQLVARHWVIEDASGGLDEVRGLGVVGQQPLLRPGEFFAYNSTARIRSPIGSMHGRYLFVTEDAEAVNAPIPLFSLRAEGSGSDPGRGVLH